jgi:adenylate cyclase
MHSRYSYRVGGSLPANDVTYVTRQADATLFQAIQQGRFCHVMGPRQIGKSSLRIKTRHRLEGDGYRCATIQLTDISLTSKNSVDHSIENLSSHSDPQGWDKQLIASIWDSLYPGESVAIAQWLEATARLSCQGRLEHFTRDLLFPELREKPLVIFIDEIDYLFTCPDALHELLNWIAKCYGLQDTYGEYQPLNFVMIGSTPWRTMMQTSLTKQQLFTAGLICEIALSNFKLSEMQPLQYGFTDYFSSPSAVLHSIYRWTGGQPFLTQKLCQIVTSQAKVLSPDTLQRLSVVSTELNSWMDLIVQSNILDNWADNDEPVHLRSIRDRLEHSPHYSALNQLYRRVFRGDRIPYSGSALQLELLISGLVLRKHHCLRPANKIYQAIFDRQPNQRDRPQPFSSHFCNQDTLRNVFQKDTQSFAKSALNNILKSSNNSATKLLAPILTMR